MEKWVWEDIRLDCQEDLDLYLISHTYFQVGSHRVVLYISNQGEVGFSVDGGTGWDNINPWVGAKILIRLGQLWPEMLGEAQEMGITPYCWPVDDDYDSAYKRRVRMFTRAGFSLPNDEGMMTYVG